MLCMTVCPPHIIALGTDASRVRLYNFNSNTFAGDILLQDIASKENGGVQLRSPTPERRSSRSKKRPKASSSSTFVEKLEYVPGSCGNLLVAACGDGTLRFLSIRHMKEIGFIHASFRRFNPMSALCAPPSQQGMLLSGDSLGYVMVRDTVESFLPASTLFPDSFPIPPWSRRHRSGTSVGFLTPAPSWSPTWSSASTISVHTNQQ